MAMAAPMVLGLVGKLVHEQGMLSSELADMLSREAEDLPSYLPTELAGLQERRQAAIRTSDLATTVVPWRGAGHGRSLAKFTVVALLLCVSWLLLRDGTRRATNSAMAGTADSVSRARTSAGELGHFIDHELPNNVRINIPENGMESKLLSYIQDPAQAAGNEKWFDFDRLKFDARSAIPRPESEEQLNNIASILKAYPLVKLKIGGYTDNTGGRRASQRLSENRAEAVRRALTGMGVDSSRLDAKGYADQHPIADNATEEGRARNRRISLRVLSK